MPMLRRNLGTSPRFIRTILRDATNICPRVGSSSRNNILIKEDLPAPLWPIKKMNSPRSIFKEMSSRALTPLG